MVAAAHRAQQLAEEEYPGPWVDERGELVHATAAYFIGKLESDLEWMRLIVAFISDGSTHDDEPESSRHCDIPRRRWDRVMFYPLLAVIVVGGIARGLKSRRAR